MGTSKATVVRRTLTEVGAVEVVHTRVFAVGPYGGNPCPVVLSAERLAGGQMQGLARRFGLDTAFILPPSSGAADIRIRYFVPDHEMGVSGHATIAAVTVASLRRIVTSQRTRVETITGTFEVEGIQKGDGIVVTMEQNTPVFGPVVPADEIVRALKIDDRNAVLTEIPIQPVSVSRAKLLVPLQNSKVVDALTPDYELLWSVCEKLQVTGFYAFTRHTDKPGVHAEARQFPLRAGFPEDAATGVAAAALGAYLATYDRKCQTGEHVFHIAQGYAMGAPSLIEAIAECAEGLVQRTAIRGMAKMIGHEQILL